MSKVTFMDPSGMAALLRLQQRRQAYGHRVLIVGCSPTVRRLLQLTALYGTFTSGAVTAQGGPA